jgi:hypothetical protein
MACQELVLRFIILNYYYGCGKGEKEEIVEITRIEEPLN